MQWGQDDFEDDPNIDNYSFKNAKNRIAANGYHGANVLANNMNTKNVQNKKIAIFEELKEIKSKDIERLFKFDSQESEYTGIKDPQSKHLADVLSIIFAGSYNHGVSCFPDDLTPVNLIEDQ